MDFWKEKFLGSHNINTSVQKNGPEPAEEGVCHRRAVRENMGWIVLHLHLGGDRLLL